MAPPFKEAEFDLMYGTGISKSGCILDVGVDAGIIRKSGSWYSYGDERIGQGRENAKTWLEENPDRMKAIDHAIRIKYDLTKDDSDEVEEADDTAKASDKDAKDKVPDGKGKTGEELIDDILGLEDL